MTSTIYDRYLHVASLDGVGVSEVRGISEEGYTETAQTVQELWPAIRILMALQGPPANVELLHPPLGLSSV